MIAAVIAFLPTLGFQEMAFLLVLGVLLFGRNLPEVGRTLGRTVSQLRRGLQDFKEQMDRDESLRELRDSVRQTRDEVARIGTIPRAIVNPANALRDAARDALAVAEAPAAAATSPAVPTGPGATDAGLQIEPVAEAATGDAPTGNPAPAPPTSPAIPGKDVGGDRDGRDHAHD